MVICSVLYEQGAKRIANIRLKMMTEQERINRINIIENKLSALPKGTLTYKTIKGKRQPYLQRTENGKSVSYYIKMDERQQVLMEIEERNSLSEELARLKKYAIGMAEILGRQPRMREECGVGYQNFDELCASGATYIDKTDFIKEWWESKDEITLITRPRRFGKTLMLSTVEHFFSINHKDKKHLFSGLKIEKDALLMEQRGKYPVIFLSLASVKDTSYENAIWTIGCILREVYDDFPYLTGDALYCQYRGALAEGNKLYIKNAISILCEALYKYHGTKPILLLDEYDTPLQEAFLYEYWDDMIGFMRGFFNCSLKTNKNLGKTLLTGITRISKESLFSDLNNLSVYSVTANKYAKYFGFTEQEVEDILDFQNIEEKKKVKEFYDGFVFGNEVKIYNPWSIIWYSRERLFKCYWVNTGGISLISELIKRGDKAVKSDIEKLLAGESIHKKLDENVTYNELYKASEMIWPLLLCTGYLKAENIRYELDTECDLSITNQETVLLFRKVVENWFAHVNTEYNDFCKYLLSDDVEGMEEYINYITMEMVSYFDVGSKPSEKEPERFYHGLVLGLMVTLRDKYLISSNRESGRGRYDIMLKPLKNDLNAIIIEFKVFDSKKEKSLDEAADNALDQIRNMGYRHDLISMGIDEGRIKEYGFAFKGKEVRIK